MIPYFQRSFDSAETGSRLVEVVCDRCKTRYCYTLTRIGIGSATAPYGIRGSHAARSAAKRARGDLASRLEVEAELVACPSCLWISAKLVAGYRLGQFRHWGRGAIWVGSVGTMSSLVLSFYLAIGLPADRDLAPRVAALGPSVSIILAGLVLLVRATLRRGIIPNRDYPHPPRRPAGSPSALEPSPIEGLGVPRLPTTIPNDLNPGWVDFQAGRQTLPQTCCGCLAPAEVASSCCHLVNRAQIITIPLCATCLDGWIRRRRILGILIFAWILAAGFIALLLLRPGESSFWWMLGGSGWLALLMGGVIGNRMTSPFRVKTIDPARGVLRFWFRNEAYLSEVIEATNVG